MIPLRVGIRLGLLLAAALLLFGSAAAAPAAATRPLTTGVTNLYTNAPLAFQRTKATEASYVRIPLSWGSVAPRGKPVEWQPENPDDSHYDWNENDAAVLNAVAAGLTPVLQVDGAPTWAQRCDSPAARIGGSAICDPDPEALRAFAIAAAKRYSGTVPGLPRVRYWQALNEPNLSLYFFPQYNTAGKALSPELYRSLLNSFYSGIKAVEPSNLVLSAGLGPIAIPAWTIGPMPFARQLLCMRGHRRPRPAPGKCGGGVHFDIFAIQPYTTGGPTHEGKIDDVEIGDLQKLQALLKAADKAGRIKGAFRRTPLWITEFSWDSAPPDPGGLPMKILVRWTAEALHQAWSAGVGAFFWYSLRDGVHERGEAYDETLESGLYFRGNAIEQDRPKPVLRAFRFPFVAYPGRKGLRVWGRTPSSSPGQVRIQIRKGGAWRPGGAIRAGRTGVFGGIVGVRYGANGHGSVRAVFRSERSPSFSMKPVPDFRHPPFG
jgi:hypothetical protein